MFEALDKYSEGSRALSPNQQSPTLLDSRVFFFRSFINLHKRQITENLLDAFEVSELLEELCVCIAKIRSDVARYQFCCENLRVSASLDIIVLISCRPWPEKFLGIICQHPRVSKSNRLHVVNNQLSLL